MSILLTIEGIDGTGKTTLADTLLEKLAHDTDFPKWIYKTKEPGLDVKALAIGAKIEFKRPGVDLREIVLTNPNLTALERELLFYVDASQHRRFIHDQGDAFIISDRGLLSHLAYLYGTLKAKLIDWEEYSLCNKIIKQICPIPNIIVYLQGDLQLKEERNLDKKKDIIEANGDIFYNAVLDHYNHLVSSCNCLVLNARDSIAKNVEAVVKYIKEEIPSEKLRTGNC